MGSTRWDAEDWTTYSKTTSAKPAAAIFRSTAIDPGLDPHNFTVRESVDSAANPKSTPLIVASDVTGSMGHLAEEIIKRGLGVIMKEVYDRKPITDPHIACMAIGDVAAHDRAPIQMTQFESEVSALTGQVEKMYIEGGGGGNHGESYNLAWYLTAYRTKCDAITKRKRKGYLFTIGDEPPLLKLSKEEIKRATGDSVEVDMTSKGLLDMLTPHWEVFHLIVGHPGYHDTESMWKTLLGERAIRVEDHKMLAEVIVSTMQVIEGDQLADVAASWSGDTSIVVANSLKGLVAARPGSPGTGPVAL